jgi:hypothetical protein
MRRMHQIDHGWRIGRNRLVGHHTAMLHILDLDTYPCDPGCSRDNHHSVAGTDCCNKASSKDACLGIVAGDEVDSRGLE